MQKIINVRKFNHDCCENHFYFINDDAIICFYQALNYDLIFSVLSFNNNNITFIITETEFREIYYLIDSMLNKIHSRKDILGYKELFEKGYFSWQSDAPANEEDWAASNKFIYNYFNIIPIDYAYKLEFINNTNNPRFCIEINTDRSRYDRMRFDMWDLYKKLEKVCPLENEMFLNETVKQLYLKK